MTHDLYQRLACMLGLLCALLTLCRAESPIVDGPSADVWKVPGDVGEMIQATRDEPLLRNFGRSAYLAIELGSQAIMLGSRIPVAPGPHRGWARPYKDGKLRVLVIGSLLNGDPFQMAQLARELDGDYRYVVINSAPFAPSIYQRDEGYIEYVAKQAREALKGDYDVIVFAMYSDTPGKGHPKTNPFLPDDVCRTILDKVKSGAGLVLVGSYIPIVDGSTWWVANTPLIEASPASKVVESIRPAPLQVQATDDPLFAGMPLEQIQEGGNFIYEVRDGVNVAATQGPEKTPMVMTSAYGAGRVVLLGWDGTLSAIPSTHAWLPFEHGMAMVTRAVTWAAQAEPPIQVAPAAETTLTAGKPGQAHVALNAPAELHLQVRDPEDNLLFEAVTKGQTDTIVSLPAFPTGTYWLEVIARDQAGQSLGWGIGKLTVTGDQTLTVTTDAETYAIGDTVKISGSWTGTLRAPRATVDIVDAMGRKLAAGDAAIVGNTLSYSYTIADAKIAPHNAVVRVYDGDDLLFLERPQFFVPKYGFDDYINILWPGNLLTEGRQAVEEAAISAAMDAYGWNKVGPTGAPFGIQPGRLNEGMLSAEQFQADPDRHAQVHGDMVAGGIEHARKYGAVCWVLQDERHSKNDDRPPPGDVMISRYRDYLKEQFGTIDKLNATWGTQYAAWDAIEPTLTAELDDGPDKIAPWLEYRKFFVTQVGAYDRQNVAMIRDALGDELPIGMDGFVFGSVAVPYAGTDLGDYLTSGLFNMYQPYSDIIGISSMTKGPLLTFCSHGLPRSAYMGWPWRDAFRGGDAMVRFRGPTFFSSFGWTNPNGRWIAEGTEQLRHGVGRLLSGAERQVGSVAFLYDYTSMMVITAERSLAAPHNLHAMSRPAEWARNTLEAQLVANGAMPSFRTSRQLIAGDMGNTKVLVLSHIMSAALSDETCAAIHRFVEDGGIVVADMAPAIFDDRGRIRETSPLDDLFGIRRNGLEFGSRPADYLLGVLQTSPMIRTNYWIIAEWYETGIEVTDGTALGAHLFLEKNVPAMISKQMGKGHALLINGLLSTMGRFGAQLEPSEIQFMGDILNFAGVQPQARVETRQGERLYHTELNTFRDGTARYVGAYALHPPDMDEDEVVIHFNEKRPTYNVRTGKYLGVTDEAALPLEKEEGALFAQLDYQVKGVSAKATDAARGGAVSIDVALQATAAPGRHVVHVEVVDPTGKTSRLYSKNVELLNGKGACTIHTALNDPAGTWTVRVHEVISHVQHETTFSLK